MDFTARFVLNPLLIFLNYGFLRFENDFFYCCLLSCSVFVIVMEFIMQPGRRWLKQQVLGDEIIREVELIEGREHPAHKCWILAFHGIDTVDQVICFDMVYLLLSSFRSKLVILFIEDLQ